MAIAGKVAITLSTENGGAWSADVTYDRLVAVKHNNNLYISRKTVTNVEPPNDEFWFLALEGYSGADVQELINRMNEFANTLEAIITGTQQVGNAKTLDGHGVEYFAPLVNIFKHTVPTYKGNTEEEINAIYNSLHDSAKDGEWYEAKVFHNASYDVLGGGHWYVNGFRISGTFGWQEATCYTKNGVRTYKRMISGGNWYSWIADATTSDLANYLSKSGGEIKTDSSARIPQLPLALINGVNENGSVVRYDDKKGTLGHLGFVEKNKPIFSDVNGNVKDLLHTGNKPTGTYTGNGDATKRTIAIGGFSNALCIWGGGAWAFITPQGGIGASANGGALTVYSKAEANFTGGVLTIATASSIINDNGITHSYHVL